VPDILSINENKESMRYLDSLLMEYEALLTGTVSPGMHQECIGYFTKPPLRPLIKT
jgi:hypothetical protein